MHGRDQCNQNSYQGQYQGNNYQGNRGLYHNPHRNFQQGNNYGQFRGKSHGDGRGNYHRHSHSRSNHQGNNNYQYHQYYGHDDEYQTDQYDPPCALCSCYNHSPKHCFKGEHNINDMEKMVYIPKGEHGDPHELPQQQELQCSTEIEHTPIPILILSHLEQTHFKSLIIFTSIFKTTKDT